MSFKLHGLLEAGRHAFWRFNRDLRADVVDLRLQVLDVAGQEILDKVNLLVNLTAGYRVSDVRLAFSRQAKPMDYLYKELQFGLRAAVGTRTLDELLENKTVIDDVVNEHIERRVVGYGLEVESVGVKDIILPGEMKTILAKVVEAEKAAQANVIRRREETAATRSLLNTAKVMEDNPVALRLKELESLGGGHH
jgi:regulator of protease activity HflC (stomatin/prohibitin superfamily)